MLACLGVGYLVAADPERIDSTNNPHNVEARRHDIAWGMTTSTNELIKAWDNNTLARKYKAYAE